MRCPLFSSLSLLRYSISIIFFRTAGRSRCPPGSWPSSDRRKSKKERRAGRRDRQFPQRRKERLQCVSGSPVWLPEAPSLFSHALDSSSLPPFLSSFSHKLQRSLIHTHRLEHPNPPQQLSPKPGSAKGRGSHSYSGHTLRGSSPNQCLAAPSSLVRTAIMHYHLPDNTHTHTHETWCAVNIPALRSLLHLH